MFAAFYSFHALVLWGLFEFGMWRAEEYTIFAGVIFIFALVILAVLVVTGWYANRKKHMEEFLKDKVSEQKQKKDKADNDAQLALVKQETMARMKSQGAAD